MDILRFQRFELMDGWFDGYMSVVWPLYCAFEICLWCHFGKIWRAYISLDFEWSWYDISQTGCMYFLRKNNVKPPLLIQVPMWLWELVSLLSHLSFQKATFSFFYFPQNFITLDQQSSMHRGKILSHIHSILWSGYFVYGWTLYGKYERIYSWTFKAWVLLSVSAYDQRFFDLEWLAWRITNSGLHGPVPYPSTCRDPSSDSTIEPSEIHRFIECHDGPALEDTKQNSFPLFLETLGIREFCHIAYLACMEEISFVLDKLKTMSTKLNSILEHDDKDMEIAYEKSWIIASIVKRQPNLGISGPCWNGGHAFSTPQEPYVQDCVL